MAKNIEIKANARNLARTLILAEQLADGPALKIHQEDIFFNCQDGRLKLRVFSPESGELIGYRRPDQSGPKSSDYEISPTNDPEGLFQVLERARGVRGKVRKKRTLLLAGQTRIHLDEVEQLGHFLELEVVMKPGQMVEDGQCIARNLMQALEIQDDDLIEEAYIDLLEQR